MAHYPVFYREVLEYIGPLAGDGEVVIDCTVGAGGHSLLLLEKFPGIRIIGFERDPKMAAFAQDRLKDFGGRFTVINDNFSNFSFYFKGQENSFAAILYDFGISSIHLDDDDRGFAIKEDGRLDMRLDNKGEYSAADVVNSFTEKDIADIIYTYGEERFSRRIARAIVREREKEKIVTVGRLSDIIKHAVPRPSNYKKRNIHPATRSFQALRIYVNNELDSIEESLKESWQFLKTGGRVLAISFHSLEDRIVKQTFRSLAKGCFCEDNTYCQCDRIPRVKLVTRKPVVPGEDELTENSRSRSAKLRVCERI